MKVALVQLDMSVQESKAERIERVSESLGGLHGYGLVVLPEIWNVGYFSFDAYREQSEPLNGPTVKAMGRLAERLRAHIVAGSFVEEAGGRYYNTTVMLTPAGTIAGTYRKIHLFGFQSKEQQLLHPGDAVCTLDTPFGKVGLSACYDLRFPELYRRMVDAGSTIFVVVSAWPAARLEHWRLFTRARALENQSFLIACNAAGSNEGTRLAGHSVVADPFGQVVAEAKEEPCVLTAEFDPAVAEKARRTFPALADRRLRI